MDNQGNLGEKQLEAAVWYAKHRAILRTLTLTVIIGVDVLLVLYAVFGFGRDLLSFDKRREQEFELLRSQLPLISASQPQVADLQLRGVELLRVGEVTDVVARVQNPNADWYAHFSYVIGLGEAVERFEDGFLFPSEEGIFVRSLRGATGTVVFNIENITWRRINPRDIPDFSAWRDERINFEVRDQKFTPAALDGKGEVSRATLTLVNRTGFGYVAPKFLVLLYRGSRLVAVQIAQLDLLRPGEAREVTLTWFDRVGAVSNIEVVPAIDLLDQGVYLK